MSESAHGAPAEGDMRVRMFVYRHFIEQERAPTADELANAFDTSIDETRATLFRLHEEHVLVVDPEAAEILMAMPFSARPTAYKVDSGDHSWWAN